MAIARDSSTNGGIVNPGTSLTYAHTCAGSNRILFVTVFGDTTDKITGVTYAGVSMTLVNKTVKSPDRWVYLFYLIAPSTGTNNVVVSASASIAICSHAASYTGAAQSGQPDSNNTATTTLTSITASTTVVASNCWLIGAFRTNVTTASAGTGSSQLQAGNGLYTADSNGVVGTGSQSMQYTAGGSNGWGVVVASFAPASGSTTYTLSVLDNIAISDSASRLANSFRFTSDNIGVSDIVYRVSTALRLLSDNAGISDSVSRNGTSVRLVSDSAGASDTVSRLTNAFRLLSDFIAIGDSASIIDIPAGAYLIRISDSLGLSDAAARTANSLRLLSDSVGLSDLFARSATGLRVVSDSVGISDAAYRSAVYQRIVTDSWAILDIATASSSSGVVDPWTAYGDWAIPDCSGSWAVPSVTGVWENV